MPVAPTTAPPQTPVEPAKPMEPSTPSAPTTAPDPFKNPLKPGPGIQPEPKDMAMICQRKLRFVLFPTSDRVQGSV
jgi:hypothetical protein